MKRFLCSALLLLAIGIALLLVTPAPGPAQAPVGNNPRCVNTYVANGLAAAGNTVISAASGSTRAYVCGWAVNGNSTTANTVKLVYGTGGTCAVGTADFGQAVTVQAAASVGPAGTNVIVPSNAVMMTPASQDLCVNLSAAQAVNVIVWWNRL